MISVNVRQFREQIKQFLETSVKTPVKITRRGQIVGVLVGPEFFDHFIESVQEVYESVPNPGTGGEDPSNTEVLEGELESDTSTGGVPQASEDSSTS